jgi:hypothetical protein
MNGFDGGIIASVIWAIAGANAGLYFAVSPATSAYRTCISRADANLDDCKRMLHQDWSGYSGDRVTYAALAGLAPGLIAWLIAYGFVASVRRRQIRPWDQSERRGELAGASARTHPAQLSRLSAIETCRYGA